MNSIQATLQAHHNQYQHLHQVRVDLHYTEMAKSGNQAQLAHQDVVKLVETLLRKKYITSYMWVLECTKDEGLHAHALLYLSHEQCETLTIMAAQECWSHITDYEGLVTEQNIELDVINHLSQHAPKALFKAHPEHFIGTGGR